MDTKRLKDIEQFAHMNKINLHKKRGVNLASWVEDLRVGRQAHKEYKREFKSANKKKVL